MRPAGGQKRAVAAAAVTAAALGFIGIKTWFAVTPDVVIEERVPGMSGPETRRGMLAAAVTHPEGIFQRFGGEPSDRGGSWPGFLGENRLNICHDEVQLLDAWGDEGPRKLWTVALGEGHGGPAVRNGKVYLLDYDEENDGDSLRCFSLEDGKEIWRRWYKIKIKRNHGVSRTVPAVTDDAVVTIGPKGHVMCVDATTGDYRWSIDMSNRFEAEIPNWYTAQCPMVDGDRVILAPGGTVLMIAVNLRSGETIWETPNPDGWMMSHSSIMPMTFFGRRMYVYCALGGMAAVAADGPEQGQVLFQTQAWSGSVLAPSPVALSGNRIFVTAGYGKGSMLFDVREESGRFRLEPLATVDKKVFASEQQTPIYYSDHLFGILPNDGGALKKQLACYHPERGLVWTSGNTNRFGLGPYLVADEKIFILRDDGVLTLAEAGTSAYVELARADVLQGRDAWAPMALAGGRLLLRDSKELICLDVSAL